MCNQKTEAEKVSELHRLPPIMIFTLQRFKNGVKNQDHVDFPISGLNMSKYLNKQNPNYSAEESIYDLYGVINHFGSLNFGHYTANCYNEQAQAWFNFNDSSVTKIVEPGSGNFGSSLYDDNPHKLEHESQVSEVGSKPNHSSPYIREQIVTPAAYVLFYIKRGFDPKGPEDFQKMKVSATHCADYMFEQAKME